MCWHCDVSTSHYDVSNAKRHIVCQAVANGMRDGRRSDLVIWFPDSVLRRRAGVARECRWVVAVGGLKQPTPSGFRASTTNKDGAATRAVGGWAALPWRLLQRVSVPPLADAMHNEVIKRPPLALEHFSHPKSSTLSRDWT